MANGKWIPDLQPTTPLVDAARQVLHIRLSVVREYLPLAIHEPNKDIEHVHQLRVGTRRARTALRIFAECLPAEVHDDLRKILRTLRRAAGAARDWDVFLDMLQHRRAGPRQKPGLDFLAGFAVAQRQTAQGGLLDLVPKKIDRLDHITQATLDALRHPPNKKQHVLRDLAQPILAELLNDLDRAAQENLDHHDNLHRVRILGKRLRYAMEVFASCFAPEFREIYYPAVEEMQDILGQANDSAVASQRLAALADQLSARAPAQWKRWQPALEGLRKFHLADWPKQRRLFAKRWQHWQASGAEKALADLVR